MITKKTQNSAMREELKSNLEDKRFISNSDAFLFFFFSFVHFFF